MTSLRKIVLLALLTLPAKADTASLDQAEKFAQNGEWEKAKQAYKAELAAPGAAKSLPPSFFFNYGTTLARTGAFGEAYVSLLHAASGAPFDNDTKHNLQLVEAQMPNSVRAILPSTWLAWWPNTFRTIPWRLWLLLGLFSSATCFALTRLKDRSYSIGVGVIAVALFAWTALAWSQAHTPVDGIVAITKVKSGPGPTFSDITALEPGALVNEEAVRDGWLKIRFYKTETGEETVGWVEPASVLPVL